MPFCRRLLFSLPPVVLAASLPFAASATTTPVDTGVEAVPTISGVTPPTARGSAPVGTARYAVPAGAVFVDSARGSDSGRGTIESPLRTVDKAVATVPRDGTVVLRGGTYQERVFVGRPMTIQAYPGEAVWFDGTTRVGAWTATGGTWEAPFTARFDHSTPASSDPFVGPQNPLAAWPEMVFVDGRRITQVAGKPAGEQFSIDQTRQKVILGFDPAGKEVRVTTNTQALVVGSPDVTLRGFGVRRFANSVSTYGAVYLARPRTVAENVVVEDVATTGISLDSDGKTGSGTIDRVTVRRAGLMGISANWADGGRIINSIVTDANFERFNNTPTAAGMKIHRTRGITIDNNRVSDTKNATGIWLDEAVVGFSITRNQVGGNGATGVAVELSSSGVVQSNQVVGHEYGAFITGSEKLTIAHNTFGYNSKADLHMVQDARRQADPNSSGRDHRYPAGDAKNTWVLRDLAIRNNLFGGDGTQKSLFQIYVMDRETKRSADSMNITMSGNAFTPRLGDDSPVAVAWGNGDNSTWARFDSVQAFQTAKRRPDTNFTLRTDAFGAGMEEARWNTRATPLTSTEAATVGAVTGLKAVGSLTG